MDDALKLCEVPNSGRMVWLELACAIAAGAELLCLVNPTPELMEFFRQRFGMSALVFTSDKAVVKLCSHELVLTDDGFEEVPIESATVESFPSSIINDFVFIYFLLDDKITSTHISITYRNSISKLRNYSVIIIRLKPWNWNSSRLYMPKGMQCS